MDSVNQSGSNPDRQPKPEVVEEWAGEIQNRGIVVAVHPVQTHDDEAGQRSGDESEDCADQGTRNDLSALFFCNIRKGASDSKAGDRAQAAIDEGSVDGIHADGSGVKFFELIVFRRYFERN